MKIAAFLLSLIVATCAQAQIVTNPPATILEAFSATSEAVIIKGITTVGTLNLQSCTMDVRAEELFNLQTSNRVYGVAIRTKTGHETIVNYVDYDELGNLISSLHYILQTDHYVSRLDHFDAYYRTRGGLSVSKYSSGNKNWGALRTGLPGAEPYVVDLPTLENFKALLITAKEKLDALQVLSK